MHGCELLVFIRNGREHSKIKPAAFIRISLVKLYKGLNANSPTWKRRNVNWKLFIDLECKRNQTKNGNWVK